MGEAEKTKPELIQTPRLAVMELQSLAQLAAYSWGADSEPTRNHDQRYPTVPSAGLILTDTYGREYWRALVWARARYRCGSCQSNQETKDCEVAIFQGGRQVAVKCRSGRKTVDVWVE